MSGAGRDALALPGPVKTCRKLGLSFFACLGQHLRIKGARPGPCRRSPISPALAPTRCPGACHGYG
ncbi:hypothetical protein [Blastochloris sulfoviridis]|uniref:Uncharacterized protein n=1 Tax=Blastochloris sulfoviridis TaxID=50712 RepID=A0A5M6HSR9_9HYPH|nr:hypothetical protein [Blastochloris sulfoviridis]KAA5598963.1 hypothetical protein F1193_13090 [Blastochloris sulfoviridis]